MQEGATMRAVLILAGTLLALPVHAADGRYSGRGAHVAGGDAVCMEPDWQVVLDGRQAEGIVIQTRGHSLGIGRARGEVGSDGVVRMAFSSRGGLVEIELRQDGDRLVGFSHSPQCRCAITLTRA
jgi:hypothetical protein